MDRGSGEEVLKKSDLSALAWAFYLSSFWSTLLIEPPAHAQEAEDPTADQVSQDPGIWKFEVGGGFRRNAVHAGFTIGGGVGVEVFGTQVNHDLAGASANLGWILSDRILEDSWLRGNPEVMLEAFNYWRFNSDVRHVAGGAAILRYNFATSRCWVPFLQGGLGLGETDIGRPDLSTTFQFNVQAGGGFHYFMTDRLALTPEYRWFHLSNSGFRTPNHGTNTQLILLGLSWFF